MKLKINAKLNGIMDILDIERFVLRILFVRLRPLQMDYEYVRVNAISNEIARM